MEKTTVSEDSKPEIPVNLTYDLLVKEKDVNDRSATVLSQAASQFGGLETAYKIFGEVTKPYRSPSTRFLQRLGLSDYQFGAVLTYAVMAFKKDASTILQDFEVSRQILNDENDTAANLVLLSESHKIDIKEVTELALDIFKNGPHPTLTRKVENLNTAVMLASAELLSDRPTMVSLMNKLYTERDWKNEEAPAILTQAILSLNGEPLENFGKVKKYFNDIFHNQVSGLNISGEINTALVALSCVMGDMEPADYQKIYQKFWTIYQDKAVSIRLAFAEIAKQYQISGVCNISEDVSFMAGKYPVSEYRCTTLILEKP